LSALAAAPIAFPSLVLYLVLGAASLGVTLRTRSRPGSQLRMQINSWWLLLPAVSVSLLLYPLGPALLAGAIGCLALRELAPLYRHAAHVQPVPPAHRRLAGAAALLALLTLLGLSWYRPRLALCVLPALVALQLVHFLLRKQARQLLPLLFFILCYGISFLIHFMHLPLAPETRLAWLFYLFVMTALNDIGQFIVGSALGKRKIAARISPNKTWHGLAGGILVSTLVSLALGGYLALAGAPWLALFAPLLAVGGFGGDLLFSAAKRFLHIKDFSRLIPGHGGILDRVDSLVVTAPLLYCAICFTLQGASR
jgi:phosphatidate cytidylyltransferase